MRIYLILAVAGAAGSLSCAHRSATPAAGQYGTLPQPAFERHIRNAVDAGDGDFDIRALREKMTAQPDNLQVRLALARAYQQRGFPEVAIEHYRLAAARFPESPEVALELAKGLRRAGQRVEAAHGLDVFLATHPQKGPEVVSWLGIIRDELGQWTEGEKAHRAALETAPGADYLHNNLGYNLLMQKRGEEAAGQFRKALELNPEYALARNNLGLALASQGEPAVREWRKLHDAATAHSNMAAVLIEQGRYADARREIDTALGYNRFHSAALNNLRLLSELDGKPAVLRTEGAETRWDRWKTALRGLFVGPLPGEPKAAPAMSSKNGGGL